MEKVKKNLLGPPPSFPQEGVIFHELIQAINSLHILYIFTNGNRPVKMHLLYLPSATTTECLHLMNVGYCVSAMKRGDERHQPRVIPAHDDGVVASEELIKIQGLFFTSQGFESGRGIPL